ncbi:hypothetical protein [Amycolatopsis sulphurea]
MPAVLLLTGAAPAFADDDVSQETVTSAGFGMLGPVGLVAVALGVVGMTLGVVRQRRKARAKTEAEAGLGGAETADVAAADEETSPSFGEADRSALGGVSMAAHDLAPADDASDKASSGHGSEHVAAWEDPAPPAAATPNAPSHSATTPTRTVEPASSARTVSSAGIPTRNAVASRAAAAARLPAGRATNAKAAGTRGANAAKPHRAAQQGEAGTEDPIRPLSTLQQP